MAESKEMRGGSRLFDLPVKVMTQPLHVCLFYDYLKCLALLRKPVFIFYLNAAY